MYIYIYIDIDIDIDLDKDIDRDMSPLEQRALGPGGFLKSVMSQVNRGESLIEIHPLT